MPLKIMGQGGEIMIIHVQPNQTKDWTFDYFLVMRYRKCELEDAYEVYISDIPVLQFKGMARTVARKSSERLGRAHRKEITECLRNALEMYDSVLDNGEDFYQRFVKDYYSEYYQD